MTDHSMLPVFESKSLLRTLKIYSDDKKAFASLLVLVSNLPKILRT